MKLKGINIFEQHVDKLVLGVVAAAALGVVAMQFLTEPNQVQIGKDTLPPARAYEPVASAANDLIARVNSGNPELPPAPKSDALTRFKSDLSRGVAPRPALVPMGPVLALGETAIDAGAGGASGPVAALQIPAPRDVIARAFGGTVDPLEVVASPEIGQIPTIAKQQPFDLFAVSVECAFDGTALKQAIQADPDGPGPARSIPIGWVRDDLEIVGVELQRERLGPDGVTWGDAAIVPPVPGRPDLLGEFRTTVRSVGDVPAMIQKVRASAADVQRPDYYTLIAGPTWQPPSEAADGLSLAQRIDRLTARMNKLTESIEGMQRTLARQQNRDAAPPPGPEGRGGRGGRGQAGSPRNDPAERPSQPDRQRVSPIEQKLRDSNAELETLAREKEELLALQAAGGKAAAANAPGQPLLENPRVRLWAHDVTAEPGATYRYRARVVTNSPLFGRDAALEAEQRELAREALAYGEWSAWTDPVDVDRRAYYFVTSASDRDAIGPARASVEVLEFYYGYFRRATVGLNPGDVIMGDAKLPANLMVFDMAKLASGARPTLPAADPSGPGVPGKSQTPRGETPTPPPAGAGEGAGEAVATTLPDRRTILTQALLLDVQSGAAGSESRAVIREDGGELVLKDPEQPVRGSLLARLIDSAKQGESQGQPQVRAREVRETTEFERPREEPSGRGNAPSGGGGGG